VKVTSHNKSDAAGMITVSCLYCRWSVTTGVNGLNYSDVGHNQLIKHQAKIHSDEVAERVALLTRRPMVAVRVRQAT
jgi:hypothetical protein